MLFLKVFSTNVTAGEGCQSLNEMRAESKGTLERFICNEPVKLSKGGCLVKSFNEYTCESPL